MRGDLTVRSLRLTADLSNAAVLSGGVRGIFTCVLFVRNAFFRPAKGDGNHKCNADECE